MNGKILYNVLRILLCCLPGSAVLAQPAQDTLGEVQIRGRKSVSSRDFRLKRHSPGQKVVSIDSLRLELYAQQSLAQVLYQQAPVFIRSYGFNGMATLNFRGSSAAQSQVLWNGVPLQNPAMGMADVSLLPVQMTDRVSLVFGSAAALWGSGNVGGVLMLENELPGFDSSGRLRLEASAGAGSFSQFRYGLKSAYMRRKWGIGVQAFTQHAANDFSYTSWDGTRRHMPHALLEGKNMMAQAVYRPSENHLLRLIYWHQQYDRQIPPALFEYRSVKEQHDRSDRLLLEWEHDRGKWNWYARSSWITDFMRYADSLSRLRSVNNTAQLFHETGVRRKSGRTGELAVFMPVQAAWLYRPGKQDVRQTRVAMAGSYSRRFLRDRLTAAAALRLEQIDQVGMALPGVNLSWQMARWLEWKANLQRTYRAPTLNELHYEPGGNAGLRPEHGWSQELGYLMRRNAGNAVTIEHELSFFNRDIQDWILWFGGAIWTPHNIAAVNSRGVEGTARVSWQRRRQVWYAGGNLSLIRARTRDSHIPGDASIGMQIPYTPVWQGQVNMGMTSGRLNLNYNHTYSGYRFVTTDESQRIPSFQTGNVQFLYRLFSGRYRLDVNLQCQNVWNEGYQVVYGRPMPGRNWLAGIRAGI